MAAIDFPASPTTGQLFSAANGVTYMYNGTLWLVQAGPGGGTGDFCAYTTANFSLGALVTLIPTGITSGNAGSWYNTTTGRYTPPAGRYRILGWLNSFNAGASLIQLIMRKNGANIGTSGSSVAFQCTAAAWAAGTCDLVIDANGSDFFDFQASAGAGSTSNNFTFTAFPLTGMQGPMGPPFGGGTGDFYATGSSGAISVGSYAVIIPNTINSGNSGGTPPYNTSNGRYTPPAGRYNISGYIGVTNGASGVAIYLAVWKNGVAIPNAVTGTSAPASTSVDVSVEGIVDANGTDYFDLRATSSAAGTFFSMGFSAFPLTGMQGLAGPVGSVPVIRMQTFTASGTYTPHANMQSGYVVGIGGGGAAGAFTGSVNFAQGSGGGGSGNQVTTYFARAQVTPTVAVTIGAGGTYVTGGAGNPGGDTIFGSLLTAKGGGGGSQYGQGGPNATGNVGTIIEYGFPGGSGMQGTSPSAIAWGGAGGGRGGGTGGVTGSTAVAGGPGLANSGGGGGGTASYNVAGAWAASNGGSGYLYVVEYCSA